MGDLTLNRNARIRKDRIEAYAEEFDIFRILNLIACSLSVGVSRVSRGCLSTGSRCRWNVTTR